MYLKKIELHGFKSFADKVNIEFQPGITGIVGPNGCGKSNISDAVRWVLGEQSVKSLRGSNMADVIFAGSQGRRAQNLAEVTLIFDNSDRMLNYDYNEVEITRRIYRQGNEAEYLLNRQQCRLKDITDLLLDTGLGRDSLSIISQGNISNFADSRPEERRAIFEEAAGVSKYKKRKIEAIRKLERTTDNLNRIKDIVYELEKQIAPLKKQKEKAEVFLTLKEKLTSIEVNVLVHEVSELKHQLDTLSLQLKDLNERHSSLDAEIFLKESADDEIKKKMFVLDNEINSLQSQLLESMSEVSRLETSKIEVDQKRKHALQSQNSDDIKKKLDNLKAILTDLIEEYNDRVERLKTTEKSLEDLSQEQTVLTSKINHKHQSINDLNQEITKNKNRQEILVDLVENKSNYHHGVKAIMELAHDNPDIIGVFGDLLENDSKYDLAVSVALGSALQFIVTKDNLQARLAIKFLKDNKAGRATFLPLADMEPRSLREEHAILCPALEGYLGVLSDFVSSSKNIDNVILNQLGNVILADDIDHAYEISKATYARYKVVTLDGNIVNVGGSLTGGTVNRQQSSILQKRELEKVKEKLDELEQKLVREKNELLKLENDAKELAHTLLQKQMSYAKLEVVVQGKKEELVVAKGEYVACIDGDAVLDFDAIDYMVQSLELNCAYGAVTGNPRVRNRSTILGRLQVSEFSSIIGLIKRAQSLMGTIFTVSGVCCLFRKDVMEEIGGWSTNMITEDIDVSWKIQTAGYNIMYEPRALCWVLMPERLYGLYKQRLRWAQGGAETILKYFPQVWRWRNRRLWPMYAEYFVTATWAILLVVLVALALYLRYRYSKHGAV